MKEKLSSLVFEVKNLVSSEYRQDNDGNNVPILNDISFKINRQDNVGIFSREAKESVVLIETLGNMRPFLRGEVKFNDEIISEKKMCSVDDLFYIDSSSLLYGHMNLLEELMFVCIGNVKTKHKKREAVSIQKEMLDLISNCGLQKFVLKKIDDMSEPMKLIVLVLLASISDSMTIICNFVNYNFNDEEMEILKNIVTRYREKGKTFIIASDKFDFISKISDKVLVLNHEGIVSYKEKEKIYEDYSSLTFYIESNNPSKVDDLVKRLCSNISFVTYIKDSRVYFKDVEMADILSSNLMNSLRRDGVNVTKIVNLKEDEENDL